MNLPDLNRYITRALWKAREEIAGAMAEIYESSLDMGEVPED